MTFEAAVRSTAPIAACYKAGLRALTGSHRGKIKAKTRLSAWRGSVNLDGALAMLCPNDSRWDYAIGFGHQPGCDGVAYVEVHHASASEVDTVIGKKDWLSNWVATCAPALRGLHPGGFHWVSTDGVHIPHGSRHRRRLASAGIVVGSIARIG